MKPQLLLVFSLLFLSLQTGCGNLSRRNNAASEAEAKAEKERKDKQENAVRRNNLSRGSIPVWMNSNVFLRSRSLFPHLI